MTKIVFKPTFFKQLRIIFNFYKNKNNEVYFNRLRDNIFKAAYSLQSFPERFAKAPEFLNSSLNIRQFVVDNFRIIYEIDDDNINIFMILGSNLIKE